MTHRLLVVCAVVCGAAGANASPTHCYYQDDIDCYDLALTAEAVDAGASLSIADASSDASDGGVP
jgi:hypothetical protein